MCDEKPRRIERRTSEHRSVILNIYLKCAFVTPFFPVICILSQYWMSISNVTSFKQ